MPSFSEIDDALGIIFKGFSRGLCYALDLPGALWPLKANRSILLGALKVAAANVTLIAGSDAIVLNRWLRPCIRAWGEYLYADISVGAESFASPPTWVEPLCALLFYAIWLIPIWGLIYAAVNITTYSELAEAFFEAAQRREVTPTKPELKFPHRQRDTAPRNARAEEETYRNLFFLILLAQKYALLIVPEVTRIVEAAISDQIASTNEDGSTIIEMCLRAFARSFAAVGVAAQTAAFVFSMLLSSLYAFDYAWSIEGVS